MVTLVADVSRTTSAVSFPAGIWTPSGTDLFLVENLSPSCLSLEEICTGDIFPSGSRASAIKRLQRQSSLYLRQSKCLELII